MQMYWLIWRMGNMILILYNVIYLLGTRWQFDSKPTIPSESIGKADSFDFLGLKSKKKLNNT